MFFFFFFVFFFFFFLFFVCMCVCGGGSHYYHYTMYTGCVLLGGQDVVKERKERRILPYMGMTVNEA